jgi:hypothetical protein
MLPLPFKIIKSEKVRHIGNKFHEVTKAIRKKTEEEQQCYQDDELVYSLPGRKSHHNTGSKIHRPSI